MTTQAINEMKETSDYDAKLEDHFGEIFDDYTLIKSKIFANSKDTNIKAPINLLN